jgi:transposase-like protein
MMSERGVIVDHTTLFRSTVRRVKVDAVFK